MSAKSNIEWTDATWTPVRARVKEDALRIAKAKGYTSLVTILEARKPNGELRSPPGKTGPHCEHVSEGCLHCYSETNGFRCLPANGTGLPFDRRSRDLVDMLVDEKMLVQPLHWKTPRKVFVCSQTDLFAEFVTDEMIDQVFGVMALCPQHTFQVLTKRAERMREYFAGDKLKSRLAERAFDYIGPSISTDSDVQRWCDQNGVNRKFRDHLRDVINGSGGFEFLRYTGWPIPNVWLGVSVEDRVNLKRIDYLRQTPAAVRFLSLEPLLEDLGELDLRGIDWVIVGGESGPSSRPCDLDWIRSIVRQCKAAGTKCFVKQLGANIHDRQLGPKSLAECDWPFGASRKGTRVILRDRKGGSMEEWPEDLRIREMPR